MIHSPEMRRDPLSGRWVVFPKEHGPLSLREIPRAASFEVSPEECPLCPGNEAYTPGEVYSLRPKDGPSSFANAPGWQLRVVPHKYPVLRIEGGLERRGEGVYDCMNGVGAHEVVIVGPDHRRSLVDFSEADLEELWLSYRHRIWDLSRDSRFRYVQIAHHHGHHQGPHGGASLSHPHSQIYALPVVPADLQKELDSVRRYQEFKERCLLCDIVRQELGERERVVYENRGFVVVAPYASLVPFELWLLPRRHHRAFQEMSQESSENELALLSTALKTALRKLYLALEDPCYSFTVQNAPFAESSFHWYLRLCPVLTLSAPTGSAVFINATLPEVAAHYLRELS